MKATFVLPLLALVGMTVAGCNHQPLTASAPLPVMSHAVQTASAKSSLPANRYGAFLTVKVLKLVGRTKYGPEFLVETTTTPKNHYHGKFTIWFPSTAEKPSALPQGGDTITGFFGVYRVNETTGAIAVDDTPKQVVTWSKV